MGNVWLIGMPGAGKSTVGRALARATGREFVDADREIERAARRSIVGIFARRGEEAFRKMERGVVSHLAERDGLVVACGGGAVLDPRNRGAMRGSGTVVFLDAPVETLRERLGLGGRRPLVRRPEDAARLLEQRAALYRETAHLAVDAGGEPQEVARRISEALP